MQPLDRPTALHSAYAEPEALTHSASYRRTPLLGEGRGSVRSLSVRRQETLAILQLATDVAMLAAAIPLAFVASNGGVLGWSFAFAFLTLMLLGLRGQYSARRALRLPEDLTGVVAVTATVAMAIISLRVLTGAGDLAETAHYWLLATGLLAVGRTGLVGAEAQARRRGYGLRPTLIVGAGTVGRLAATRLSDHPELGLRPIGFLDKDPIELAGSDSLQLPVLGASWDLEQVIDEHGVRQVVIAFSTAPDHVLLELVRRCRKLGVSVAVIPRLFEVEGDRVSIERLGALPLITDSLVGSQRHRVQGQVRGRARRCRSCAPARRSPCPSRP